MGLSVSKRRIREAAVVNSLAGNETTQAPSVASVSTALAAKLAATITSPSSGQYVRWNGSAWVNAGIQAGDVPTLNQNTTGTAANVTGTSNSTLVTLSALSLPSSQVTGLGTAAALNVPASGDAASGEVVKGDDSRLSDSRTPTAHTHTVSQLSDASANGRSLISAADFAAMRSLLSLVVGTNVLAPSGNGSGLTGITNSQVSGLGTAATRNVPASGNAGSTEVVLGNDTRLGGGATVVSAVVSSNTSITGTSAAWVNSTLSIALTEGTWDLNGTHLSWFWGATGKNTQNRLLITAGSITKTDGRVVGECRVVGGTSSQMTYTASTGVISGASQSSGTNSVVFLMDGFLVIPSGGATITLQYLTGPGSGETVILEQGSCLKATKR